jgi:hypothetical protein
MAPWEYEFALSFLNDGHFRVTDPGPLHVPVLDFSIRRNEDLQLILETRTASNAKSAAIERPSGTVRISTEWVGLENPGGIKVKLLGVVPYAQHTSYESSPSGEGRLTETSQIHALEAIVREGAEGAHTIEWVENLPPSPFHWPDWIRTETDTKKTRTIGLEGDSITLFDEDSRRSSSAGAAKILVAGAEVYVCALDRKEGSGLTKPGCIIFRGNPDDEFRKKVRLALSFALNVFLVELGSAVFCKDWEIVSFKARAAYSIDQQVIGLTVLPPAPLHSRWQHGIDRIPLMRLVNAIVDKYEILDFGNLSWAYWHALCATPHIASVHFGAATEMLLRQYAATKPKQFPGKIIDDSQTWDAFSKQVREAISKLEIGETKKEAIAKNVGGINRVHHRDTLEAILKDIGISLGIDEARAWRRRNDAAHGNAMDAGEELDVIRDIKLLKIVFHRIFLRMVNGADSYTDYATPGFPIRRLTEQVPSQRDCLPLRQAPELHRNPIATASGAGPA